MEIIAAMENKETREFDSALFAGFFRHLGYAIADDGNRSQPILLSNLDLYKQLKQIGDLVLGTKFKVSDRYPRLAGLMITHFAEFQNEDDLLDGQARIRWKRKSDELCRAFVAAYQHFKRIGE